MPDVVGSLLSSARTELRGVRITIIEEFDEDARDNEVIAQSVPEGVEMPTVVDLTVARQPITVYLDTMRTVSSSGSLRSTPASLDGRAFPRSLVAGDNWLNSTQASAG